MQEDAVRYDSGSCSALLVSQYICDGVPEACRSFLVDGPFRIAWPILPVVFFRSCGTAFGSCAESDDGSRSDPIPFHLCLDGVL